MLSDTAQMTLQMGKDRGSSQGPQKGEAAGLEPETCPSGRAVGLCSGDGERAGSREMPLIASWRALGPHTWQCPGAGRGPRRLCSVSTTGQSPRGGSWHQQPRRCAHRGSRAGRPGCRGPTRSGQRCPPPAGPGMGDMGLESDLARPVFRTQAKANSSDRAAPRPGRPAHGWPPRGRKASFLLLRGVLGRHGPVE